MNVPLRYDKIKTKVLEINKQVIIAFTFVFIVYRTVNLTFMNDYSGPVEPLRTFFKNHNIKAHVNGPNMLRPIASSHTNVGTCCV